MMRTYTDNAVDIISKLQTELQKDDTTATVSGTEDNMEVYYKGYKFTIDEGIVTSSEKIIVDVPGDIEISIDSNPGNITKDKDGNIVSGTEDSPYLISSIEDLVAFSDLVNADLIPSTDVHIKLVNTLDFNSADSYDNSTRTSLTTYALDGTTLQTHTYPTNILTSLTTGDGWEPIGYLNNLCFNGTFDGNNNEIKNIYINYVEDNYTYSCIGLFIANTGIIKNLKITGNITTQYNSTSDDEDVYLNLDMGTIVGDNYGTIYNCTSDVAVTGIRTTEYNDGLYIGGIAGYNTGTISNCSNIGKIIVKSNTKIYLANVACAGGIVGISNYGTIENCNNKGEIAINNTYYANIAGIAGDNSYGGIVSNCYNTGAISASSIVNKAIIGGIIGQNAVYGWSDSCPVTNCYNIGNLSSSDVGALLKGGIIGQEGYMEDVQNNFDSTGVGAIGGFNFVGIGENISLTEEQIINYITTNTYPAASSRIYAIDDRLKEGVYVSYDTSELSNQEISTSLTGDSNKQYAYPSQYTEGWRVLSNNGSTVELISTETVNVGYYTTSKEIKLFNSDGYINAVKSLNLVANAYLNTDLGISARSVGATSNSIDSITATIKYKPTDYSQLLDTEFYKDYVNMLYSGTMATPNNNWYYIASRDVECFSEYCNYNLVNANRMSDFCSNVIYWMNSDGTSESNTNVSRGVRPVITLKSDLVIKEGSGTSSSPYVLE